jgi:8-oxo-dGTP pyrophosphatase MutT (NUDIX family)
MVLNVAGHWEFPKGKKEEGETDEETALRELKEETGLIGEVQMEAPVEMTYRFTRNAEQVDKRVLYYYCRVPDGSEARIDTKELSDSTWLPLEQLVERATYPEMKEAARTVWQVLGD